MCCHRKKACSQKEKCEKRELWTISRFRMSCKFFNGQIKRFYLFPDVFIWFSKVHYIIDTKATFYAKEYYSVETHILKVLNNCSSSSTQDHFTFYLIATQAYRWNKRFSDFELVTRLMGYCELWFIVDMILKKQV